MTPASTATPITDGGRSARRPFDKTRIARAVREILVAIGEDPERDGLRETPDRVARAYGEIFSGLREDPTRHLARTFAHEGGADDLVMVRHIEIFSVCEHHLLPFTGVAHVAYLPGDGSVVGLSKIARMVDDYARRPQIQERLGAQIADALMVEAGARGAAVVIEGVHMCMRMRGVAKHGADMLTTAVRGLLATDPVMHTTALAALRST
ncbi:MAG: GTP cyclohydrolase I FolE [Candidatus Binatia bacterium]